MFSELWLLAAFVPALGLRFVMIHFRSSLLVYLLAVPAVVAALSLTLNGFNVRLLPADGLALMMLLPLTFQLNRSWPLAWGRLLLVSVLLLELALLI